ncbi:RNB domain-containing protein [Streptomyces sp. DconLS]|nr:RNB domain-containing protein [Streptomyces sp. DconLS]
MTGAPEAPLRAALAALRARLGVPEGFPPEVGEEAERAAKSPPPPSYDATDLPFFTLDPPGSPDLDQATHLSRRGTGYRVRYAIADVAAFVAPGGALDAEAQRRVNTLYFPDERVPLHPAVLSEGAASLLPGRTRPAVLWTIDLDAEGRALAVEVRRALVRSRARLDYAGVQRAIDTGTAEEPVALLREIGRARERQEAARGGISLTVPEQEITERDHTYALSYRAPLPAEAWNAQLSLLTGMAAADLMLARGTGILRTLPPAPDGAVARLRRTARALGVDWPHHVPYAAVISALDPRVPHHAAFLQECTTLLRGAGYTVFRDGALPAITTHAAMAAPYTHCTAPCGASPTATPWNSPCPPPRTTHRPTGSSPPSTPCRTGWPTARNARARSSTSPSTSSPRPCSRTVSGRPSTPAWSTWTTTTRASEPSNWPPRPSSAASRAPTSPWVTPYGSAS